ncbi:MAG: serine/threonine-protein kinase [Polyangia bacterium]|jgi:serine/threonine-protein kinase|nr:serine/threonine-protein kinase [Polyangia bacterium]
MSDNDNLLGGDSENLLSHGELVAGCYKVGWVLDTGGYALVYEGVRVEDGAEVVIKALRRRVLDIDPAAVERFKREAKMAMELRHPRIVAVLDWGETDSGILYIVMERLYGQALSQLMYTSPAKPEEVRRILTHVLEALCAAHDQGIVHRDIKPSNVFLCAPQDDWSPGETFRVKVLDFGLSKGLWGNRATFCAPLTAAGQRVGTPGYLAPEMLLEMGVVTPQSDLYAVGLLGYELLTAEPAFEGKGLEAAKNQLTKEPKPAPPAVRRLPIFRIIKNLIERDPADRYMSAVEALHDLESLG